MTCVLSGFIFSRFAFNQLLMASMQLTRRATADSITWHTVYVELQVVSVAVDAETVMVSDAYEISRVHCEQNGARDRALRYTRG